MDTVRKCDYFSMETAHKVGEGARLLGALRDEGVNLLAFTGFPSGRRAQVDFIPADTAQFRQAAKKLKLKLGPRKTVFLAHGDDRPGAIAEICEKLAAAGINMIAMDAVAIDNGRYGAMFWVEPRSVNKAAKVLGAA
ncbi:MAG: hypothetical protein ACT4PS_09755 [Betaproteobacteria bacterium]